MPDSSLQRLPGETLRWFVGVPVLGNPLILAASLQAAAVLWLGTALLTAAVQWGLGGLSLEHLRAAFLYGGCLAALALGLSLCLGLIFFYQGYAVLYRFERGGVFSEAMRLPAGIPRLGRRPFAVAPQPGQGRTTREIAWEDVREVRPLKDIQTLLLMGRGGTLMRVYCPDSEVYEAALRYLRSASL